MRRYETRPDETRQDETRQGDRVQYEKTDMIRYRDTSIHISIYVIV